MRYRKLKARQIFDGHRLKEGVILVVREDGTVEDLVPEGEVSDEVESWDGILVPGWINCHCHLELSHLKGAIPDGSGLVDFVLSVVKQRGQKEAGKLEQIKAAEAEMFANGTVAVADICNTIDAIEVKKKSEIAWHSLVEVINLHDDQAQQKLLQCEAVWQQHLNAGLPAVLTPHAPYSISSRTFAQINQLTEGKTISVHNQETAAENELYQKGTGGFLKLFAALGIEQSPFPISGRSSLQTWLPSFTNGQTIFLVHNTFISEEDIVFAKDHARQHGLQLVYCLCPNANWYIEKALPPVDLLLKHDCTIVLGTDSYGSNWQLSIATEIKRLKEHFPQIEVEVLLQWATRNGAAALGLPQLGTFEKGKKPGVVLFSETDFTAQRIV